MMIWILKICHLDRGLMKGICRCCKTQPTTQKLMRMGISGHTCAMTMNAEKSFSTKVIIYLIQFIFECRLVSQTLDDSRRASLYLQSSNLWKKIP